MENSANAASLHPRQILCDVLHLQVESVTDSAEQGQLPGWDSMNHLTFVLALETHYGIPVNKQSVLSCRTLKGACDYLRSLGKDIPSD